MRWRREGRILNSKFPSIRKQEHALSHLRDAIENRIQERITTYVAMPFENITDFLSNVLPAMIQNIRDVLHEQSDRPKRIYIVEIRFIEFGPRIMQKGFRVLVNFP
jgi:hypothetical protein